MPTSSAERGFSLLEILIVLAIVATVSGLGLASLQPARRASAVRAEALSLALWLEHQRGLGLTTRSARAVRIVPAARDGARGSLPSGSRGDGAVRSIDFLAGEGAEVTFYPDGSASGARLALAAGQRTATVTVDALTGRIAVLER